jgi:hypothetical protein
VDVVYSGFTHHIVGSFVAIVTFLFDHVADARVFTFRVIIFKVSLDLNSIHILFLFAIAAFSIYIGSDDFINAT